ncbi:MAG TPA: hypothetical protein O0X39_08235 [Methanocorpusculum sp.]|nr:hypothetical protein [Methanocorpusculum sp.]
MIKQKITLLLFAALLITLACTGSAYAATAANSANVNPGLTISELKLYPGTLMPSEEGTAYVTLTNTGEYTVFVEGFIVYSASGVKLTQYDQSLGNINPKDQITVSFAVKAGDECGTFYPYITMNYTANTGNENRHFYAKIPVPVTVDDKSITISVLNRPDVFQPDTTQTLALSIGNVRANDIEGVELSVSGDGVTSREGKVFVGGIPANSKQESSITVLTTKETKEVTLTAAYRNGANWHEESINLPINAGISRTGADLVINNIEVKQATGYTTIKGDVNNAGLTTAKAVVVTTTGTEEAGPYYNYVVGSLDTDGLSEFTVTFKTDKPEATVLLTYKDNAGNTYNQTKVVKLSQTTDGKSQSSSTPGTDNSAVLPTVLILIAAALIFAFGIVAWRKGIFRKKE